MLSFLKWLYHKRWLRRTALVIAALAGVYFGIEWFGEWRWKSYSAEARARGVKLTLPEIFERPEIADDENFAMLPLFEAVRSGKKKLPLYPYPVKPYVVPKEKRKPGPPSFDMMKARLGMVENLWVTAAENTGTDAEVVLLGLRKVDAELQQIRAGAGRPKSRFYVDWRAGFSMDMDHFTTLMVLQRYLLLKIHGEIEMGRGDVALSYWDAGWSLARAGDENQTLIACLVHISIARTFAEAVSAGLAGHVWTDEQLLEIERRLAEENELQTLKDALAGERACLNSEIDKYAKTRDLSTVSSFFGGSKVESAMLWVYSRQRYWWRSNQLWVNRHHDALGATIDAAGERWSPLVNGSEFDLAALPTDWRGMDLYLAQMCCQSYGAIMRSVVLTNTFLRLAGLGCALERHRRAVGAYPEKLEELVPKFLPKLPHEATSGAPFRYRRDEKTGYLLYSIGLDGEDNRGKPGTERSVDVEWPDWRWWAPPAPAQP